jgi:hypothetical protein
MLAAAPGAQAAVIPVTTCNASDLSTAIDTANSTPAVADTITLLGSCTYSVPNPPADTNHNWYGPSGLPAISSDITIQGNGDTITR